MIGGVRKCKDKLLPVRHCNENSSRCRAQCADPLIASPIHFLLVVQCAIIRCCYGPSRILQSFDHLGMVQRSVHPEASSTGLRIALVHYEGLQMGLHLESRTSVREDPTPRIETICEGQTYHCIHTLPAYQVEVLAGYRFVFSDARLVPKAKHIQHDSVTGALKQAWIHVQGMDPCEEQQDLIQQDLIGCFMSVPLSRICSSLQHYCGCLSNTLHWCRTLTALHSRWTGKLA